MIELAAAGTLQAEAPFYLAIHNEVQLFEAAWRRQLPIMLKGPTGCGKTRFVEHMAARLSLPLFAVACHEDLTVADLVGRHLLVSGETVWVDGPLTRAVRQGGVCYLDEIVEARQDTTVVIHPLADHRRELSIERQGGISEKAAPEFSLVISYNPGYQSVMKDLKVSTRQRMVSIELGFPPPSAELLILRHEAQLDSAIAEDLVRLATAIRGHIGTSGLREAASTRTLVAAALLIQEGLPPREAAYASIGSPLSDDPAVVASLRELISTYIGS